MKININQVSRLILKRKNDTPLVFYLHPKKKPKYTTPNVHRQGTRRYCSKCRQPMTKTKRAGMIGITSYFSSGRPVHMRLYKCSKGHEQWAL